MTDQPWGSYTVKLRRVFLFLWRTDVETYSCGKAFIKLPFRFWLQVQRYPRGVDKFTVHPK